MDRDNKLNPTIYPHFIKIFGILLPALLLCLPIYGQPANDECETATVVGAIPFTDAVDTTTADPDPPSLSCNGDGMQTDGNAVWYVWTPDEDITVNISTAGSTEPDGDPLDTAHGVFTGSCGALTEVACVDIGLTDDLIFEAEAGVTYFIKFGEFLGGVGGGNLMVSIDLPPPPEQIILESVRDGISPPISSIVTAAPIRLTPQEITTEEVPMFMKDEEGQNSLPNDEALRKLLQKRGIFGNPNILQNTKGNKDAKLKRIFDGAENDDNAFLLGILLAPPDTDGDVGPKNYVQITNLVTTIFNKKGDIVLGPFGNNIFWTGLGGLCESTNRGDPIVLYDEQTDRWFASQFAFDDDFTLFSLCIAVSTTGDPTGSYYQHEFDFTAIGFPDYPKYGFATDSIGMMVNLFNPFQGAGLGAIDKAEAFSDQQTTLVFFKPGASEFGFVVGDNDGPEFDNLPPTFATNNGGSDDQIDIWQINPDFATPVNTTIAEVASIPVTPFDADICPEFRERCINQPGSGTGTPPNNITFLEAISDRLMHRLQIRNYDDDDQRAVVCHTIDANGSGKAGVRWYEFRNDGSSWSLYQEGTFSPDADHRWMCSIAMNKKGEIGLGYSISSSTTYPSIGVAGQTKQASGSGILNVGELVAFDGNIDQFVQRQTSRWGDYSAMAIDPLRDNRFWYTTEHAKPNSFIGERFGWATKVIEFKLK
jgi:hypothetical protein